MDESDTTHAILREIRDQLKETNLRVDRLAGELAQTRQDLTGMIQQTNRKLDTTNRQLLTTETRLVIEISGLRSVLVETEPDRRELRDRLEQCERDIAELRQRD